MSQRPTERTEAEGPQSSASAPRASRLESVLDLSTKRIVLLATALALVAEAVLAGRGWPALLTLAVVFACAAMAATSLDRRAVSVVLFCTYLTPAAIFVSHEEFHPFYTVMWLAALFGAMVPDGVRTTWRIPGRWRLPLVFWALVTIVSSVVVTGRELDFNRALLAAEFQPGSALGGLPPFTVTWVLHVTTTQLLGILWFDWLFGQGQRILRLVVSSLAASAAILMFVAAYQAFGEVEFLNPTTFGATGRASGTLLDANLAGAIGAMWIGIAVAAPSLWTEPPRWLRSLCWLGVVFGWLTVLATGSRTAQLGAVIISAFALMAFVRREGRVGPEGLEAISAGLGSTRNRGTLWLAVTRVLPAVAVIVSVLLVLGALDVGPIGRLWRSLPDTSLEGWTGFALELWNRNGYGTASTAMIREFPWFGIGIGSFQTLLPLFAPGLAPDNAQNWYRHIVTELGVVGALGPLVWTVLFAAAVFGPVHRQFESAWALRGVLMSAGVVALVGVPGQDLIVALTLWTVAFWYSTLRAEVTDAGPVKSVNDVSDVRAVHEPLSARAWAALLALVLVFAAGVARDAVGPLRPPIRSERIDWPYTYGFSEPERGEDGQPFRWVAERAVMVVDAPQRTMTLKVRVPHASPQQRPVVFSAWVDGRRVMRRTINAADPLEVEVPVADGRPRVRLETQVSGTLGTARAGAESRQPAAAVSWTFTGDENPWAAPVRDAAGRVLAAVSLVPNVPLPSTAGTPITWIATATGGKAPYSYRFRATSESGETVVRDWDASSLWTWTPVLPGSYTAEVSIRNAGSSRTPDASLTAKATVTMPTTLTVTGVRAEHGETAVMAPAAVTLTATALAGTRPYTYQFVVFDGTAWAIGRDWGPSNSWTWTPTAGGSYTFQAWVRNAGSTRLYDAWGSFGPVTVTEPDEMTITRFEPDATVMTAGQSVTWTASALGGRRPYSYRMEIFDGRNWTVARDWHRSNVWTWTPWTSGRYALRVLIRGTGSTAAYDARRSSGPIAVRAPDALTVTRMTASESFPVRAGTPVVWTVAADGGNAPYTFQFWVNNGAGWTVGQMWSASNTWTWTPTSAGTYAVHVWARNAGSETSYDAVRAFDLITITGSP